MSAFWIVFEVLLNGYDAAYLISISSKGAGLQNWVKKRHLVLYWIFLVTAFCAVNFSTQFSLISVIVFPCITLTFYVFLYGRVYERMFWLMLPFTLMFFLELIILSSWLLIAREPISTFIAQGTYRLLWALFNKIIESCVFIYLHKQKQKKIISIFMLQLFLSIGIVWFSMIICVLISGIGDEVYNQLISRQIPMLILCYMVCLLCLILMMKKERQTEVEMLKTNCNLKVIEAYKRVRQFRIDTFQYLQGIWTLVPNTDDRQKYIEAFEQIDQKMQINYDTGDELLDIVMAIKWETAFDMGIAIHMEGKLPPIHFIVPEDICLIMDHILNCVLSEVQSIHDPDAAKVVLIKLEGQKRELVIQVENPTDGKIELLVMNGIQNIIDKYQGNVIIEHKEYYRTMVVRLTYPCFLSDDRLKILKKKENGYEEASTPIGKNGGKKVCG